MREKSWRALGQALKTLRELADIQQKTVIDTIGIEMSERTLRAYESGEQRPGRDRLIGMLVTALRVTKLDEINRCLDLAKYAGLSDREIQQYRLNTASARQGDKTGQPTDFRIEVSTLIVTDGQGRELWRHQFPTRLAQAGYDDRDAIKRCTFYDLDGDGRVETLFVYIPIDFGSVGATLVCFEEDGRIKWEFTPGKTIRDSTGREYCPPYFISNVRIIPMPDSNPQILVSSNHYLHNPNQIAMLDSSGAVISEYWHSGHLLYIAGADVNGDGIEEILMGGVNNGYGQATMLIFDPRSVSGVSAQPGRQILGFSAGTEKAIVLFPKTCVSKNSPYNRVAALWVTKERRIVVPVAEGVSEARNPGVMIYELDFGLKVVNARPDSHLQESHRALEAQGVVDHSWTEEENETLRSQVLINGYR